MGTGLSKIRTKASLYISGKKGKGAVSPEEVLVLSSIGKTGSLMMTAKTLGLSYKHVWNVVRRAEEVVGQRLVEARHGGTGGGGGCSLTPTGARIVREYSRMSDAVQRAVGDEGFWEALGLKLSIRNRLKGEVVSISSDKVSSKVVIRVESPGRITALVTREAVDELGLKVGDKVYALIKSTEVVIAKEDRNPSSG
jgi:molybdate transport system regulatory protein